MRNHPLIFRLQEPPPKTEALRDYSSCLGYGEMVTILSPDQNPSVDFDFCYELMLDGLRDVQSGDYILWSGGDPMSMFVAGLVIGSLGVEGLKWLRWDRRTDGSGARTRHGYYTPVEFGT